MLNKISHIGWAVISIDRAIAAFAAIGFSVCSEKIFDDSRGVDIIFLENSAGLKVELIEPVCEKNPISNILKKSGSTPYHICIKAKENDWIEKRQALLNAGYIEILKPADAPALANLNKNCCKAVFMYHKSIGIIEFEIHCR